MTYTCTLLFIFHYIIKLMLLIAENNVCNNDAMKTHSVYVRTYA